METNDKTNASGIPVPAPRKRVDDGTGSGHPLPESVEARHDEIPESLEHEKGHGDDARAPTQAMPVAVTPDGTPYPSGEAQPGEDFAQDTAAHQDRGQSWVDEA
jgi:hypothetical protein